MLSSAADALPGGEGWQFEPKWDGFRTLVFRDGDEILLQSRDEKPMNRYFPELIAPWLASTGSSSELLTSGEISALPNARITCSSKVSSLPETRSKSTDTR